MKGYRASKTRIRLWNEYVNGKPYLDIIKIFDNKHDINNFNGFFRRYKNSQNYDNTLYDIETCRRLIIEIGTFGRGLAKKYEQDPNLEYSIRYHIDDKFITPRTVKSVLIQKAYLIVNPDDIGKNKCKRHGNFTQFYGFQNRDHVGYMNGCVRCTKRGVSEISQELFDEIYKKLPQNLQHKCKYSSLNNEKSVFVPKELKAKYKCHYFLDFVCGFMNIEFDGDYWHEKTIQDDILRDEYLKTVGYITLRIKECDYRKHPEKVLNKCLMFLTQKD